MSRCLLRWRVSLAALAAVLAGITGCSGPGSQSPATAGSQDTVVLGLTADLDSLNPYLSVRAATRDVAYNLYASLMVEEADFQDGPPSFTPDLAEAWERSEDGLAITFHLRRDAHWSDGTPITAEDVRFSQEAAAHPDVAWLAAEVKKSITDVVVVDQHTVRFSFARSYPYQLMDANDGVILPAHVWSVIPFERWRSDGPREPAVVSGPFRLERWIAGQSIELAANENYYDSSRPGLERVAFRILPDAVAGFEQFLAGRLDFWDRVDPRQMERVAGRSDMTLHRYPDRYYGFIGWNCRRDLFRQAQVRRALSLAINSSRLASDVLHDTARPAGGPVPPVFGTRLSRTEPLAHDPQQARQLLDAAGWRRGDDDGLRRNAQGTPFSFQLQVNADAPWRRDMALMIQADLRQVGVQVEIVSLERRAYGAAHREGDFDAFIGGWRLPTKIDLAVTFASHAMKDGVNYGGYQNPELDRLLETISQATDFQQALPLVEQSLDIIQDDQPYTFLYWQDRLVGISGRIHNARPNAQSALFNLAEWSLTSGDQRP